MSLLLKIKDKGLSGCIKALAHRNIKLINWIVFKWYSMFPVDEYSIVLESEGDCSDNSYALFDYLNKNGFVGKYHITWVVDHPENYTNTDCVKYYQKNIYGKISHKTIKSLARCHWYIYDHCNMMENFKKREFQIIVNLWHGCGIKSTQYAQKESNIDYMITTGKFFEDEVSKVFGVNLEKIYSIGYPRTDYFFQEYNDKQLLQKETFKAYRKVILWMPTFRRSTSKNLDEQYFNSYTGLPIITTEESLSSFDGYLREKNMLCVFKIHHLQAELPAFKHTFTNIRIINDEEVHRMGLQLYEFITLTDALITDYSSIATDYMLLNRPILYTIDDYDSYSGSRGFCFENAIEYLAGYKATNEDTFYKALDSIMENKDEYKIERNRINKLFNDNTSENHCRKIAELIGLTVAK